MFAILLVTEVVFIDAIVVDFIGGMTGECLTGARGIGFTWATGADFAREEEVFVLVDTIPDGDVTVYGNAVFGIEEGIEVGIAENSANHI